MLTILKGANAGLMFFLELGVYLAVGYWGFTLSPNWAIKILLGVGGPVLFAVIWGVFGSPKASIPLHGMARAALEILWFGGGIAAAASAGLVTASVVFAGLFIVNAILRIVWNQI
ncbi:YrdB family protein [Sphaerisporangium corydalis]|uniref:YrdB family protein n=1 Tax=Sphaerisporangium corydalis TaxID=1441875 RepID=A0ABV9E6Y8_9ACTN|nr:YrdB family protein [Sphaerisporangium corydalis]